MNMLKGLYFPGTVPDKERFASLLTLLVKLDYYRVVEEDEPLSGKGQAPSGWEARVVMPLGEDRPRFLAMIRDIKAHAAEFYEGFLAAISAEAETDQEESSVWRLVANLHGGDRGDGRDRIMTEKLWQARLVLKLAEILAEEQAEIDLVLESSRGKEQELLACLKGDFDDEDEDSGIFAMTGGEALSAAEGGRVKRLLAAWGVLFAMDNREYGLLVTDSEEAAAMVFDAWEELASAPPRRLSDLDLPGPGADIDQARTEKASAGAAVTIALQEILGGDQECGVAALAAAAELWNRAGLQGSGRWVLALHLLEGFSLKELWGRISRLPPGGAAGRKPAIIGVLRPAPAPSM